MGRAAASPLTRQTAAVRPFLLVGPPGVGGDLTSHLRTAFGDALSIVPDLSAALTSLTAARSIDSHQTPALAIGVFRLADRVAHGEFAREARASQIPALSVAVEDDAILIGPLAFPTRPGCGHCARLRMLAAVAAKGLDGTTTIQAAIWPTGAIRRLATEIRAILRDDRKAQRLVRHVLAIDRTTSAVSRHRVVPMPYCEICGGAAAIADEPCTTALDGWVDPLTGVITALAVESPIDTGLVSPIVVTAAPPHIVEPDGTVRRLPVGWGKGLTPADAVLSAVGEAIERYAPSVPDRERIVVARPRDLDGPYLDPGMFALYSPEQYARVGFPFAPYDRDLTHPWVRGWWLGSGEPVWVHAVFVYLSIEVRRDQLICQGSSNGLAASTSIDDASLRATMELVERDALMDAWLTATPGRRVTIDNALDPGLKAIVDAVEAQGGAVELYVLDTSACGTTALCISLGDGRRWPGVTLALGVDRDPLAAIERAILELGQTGPHLRRLLHTGSWPIPAEAADVRDMLDHAAYYFPVERRHVFDRLRPGGTPIALGDLMSASQSAVATCEAVLDDAGIRVAIVDVTSPDVRTGPFRVARAVSPDLQGISYGFGLDRQPVSRIARRRVSEVPAVHPIW